MYRTRYFHSGINTMPSKHTRWEHRKIILTLFQRTIVSFFIVFWMIRASVCVTHFLRTFKTRQKPPPQRKPSTTFTYFWRDKNAYVFYIHAIKLRRSKIYIPDHSGGQQDRASHPSKENHKPNEHPKQVSDAITRKRDALQPFTTFELAFDQMHSNGSLLFLCRPCMNSWMPK